MSTGVGIHDSGPAPSVVVVGDSGGSSGGSSSGGGIPAPYGRACINCSRAKCKCILRPVGGACERCHRLSKPCQPSNTVRRRSRKPRSSRTAQLEEKLDGLVTMLRQSGRPDLPAGLGVDVAVHRAPRPAAAAPAAVISPSATAAMTPSSSELGDARARGRANPFPTPTMSQADNSPEGTGSGTGFEYGDADDLPSPAEAETMFEGFRDRSLKAFPFMCFGDATTARALRAERPFLWLCVMTVASRVTSQQLALGRRVRQIVSQKVILENERSMDHLLGILVILGWANHQLGNKPFKCMFCQVAIGLVFDLELARDPLEALNPFLCFKAAQERADRDKTTVAQTFFIRSQAPRTMEQRRVVVACYLVTSSIASFLGKMDPLRWTPYMDECLQMLDDKPESPLDRSLAALVKMQLLKDEAGKLSSRIDVSSREGADGPRTPPAMYVKMLQAQLQRIIQDLPADLRSMDTIISQLHTTELSIQEVALSAHMGAPAHLPDVARLDILYACLHAVKAWFDHFFTLDPASYFHMAFLAFAQLTHCVVALYRLSVLEDPVWDRAGVRSTVDLIATLDEIARRFTLVCGDAGLRDDTGEGTSFDKAVKTIRGLKNTWEVALAPFARTTAAGPTAAAGPPGGGLGVAEADFMQFGFDLMESRMFTDILTPFDF
ncbi:hypothetical protein LX36DRAFT_268945 [Colletotrichum falcatum]|nr:hypothetical protein LX36DRAFT_268945 [Colletotrichum falcatum]